MAHLKKDAISGHLLKHPTTGHLSKGCPAGVTCPTDCTGCTALVATITGGSGCCCAIVNRTNEPLTRLGCSWSTNWLDPTSFGAVALNIFCLSGSDEWEATLEIQSAPDGCTPSCGSATTEIWKGKIPNVSGCADGNYTLTFQSGDDCSGQTLTLVVS